MNRFLYSLLLYLLSPAVFARLLIRARRAPAYGQRKKERFGFVEHLNPDKPVIWVHSVSVGETIASAPMVKALQQQYPQYQILVTTMTPTGSEQVRKIHGDTVAHCYAPYDLPDAVNRFLNRTRPEIAVVIDTELWPNTIASCAARNIPVVIANARLSEKSAKGYGKFGRLTQTMLQQISMVAAQNTEGGQRFLDLGLPESALAVTGSVKFDLDIAPEIIESGKLLRQRWQQGAGRDIQLLVAASTHEGEDQQIIDAYKKLLTELPDLRLLLVPRHPERFDSVYGLIENNELKAVRHSKGSNVCPNTRVILGDTMGEMMRFYAASDVAFVGGSLVATGGHNMLEPAALGLPVLSGPHVFNFEEISQSLVDAKGMLLVKDSDDLAKQTLKLLNDLVAYQQMGENAEKFVSDNRGALNKTLEIITQLIN